MRERNNIYNLNRQYQTGAALLIAMVVLASVAAFYLMSQFGAVDHKLNRQDARVEALAEAKKAIIAYAVNYVDTLDSGGVKRDGEYGFLPCPDFVAGGILAEGNSDGCTGIVGDPNVSVLGRFPWKSLDVKPLRDDANECLWYAVSGEYKNAANKTEMLNDDSNGLFELYDSQGNVIPIYGATPEDRIVALIFAPGKALAAQDRSGFIDTAEGTRICRGSYNAADYLEGNGVHDNSVISANADTVSSFIKSGTNSDIAATPFNDRVAIVTQGDIWDAVKRRKGYLMSLHDLTRNATQCLADYGNAVPSKHLPWAAALNLDDTDYRVDNNYIDSSTALFGRLPEDVSNSENQLDNNPGAGGGDTGGVIIVGPPDCQPCKQKYEKYLEELAEELADFRLEIIEANVDYQECLLDPGETMAECDAELVDDLADAQADFDQEIADIAADELLDYTDCLAQHSCASTGGGTVSDCSSCQTTYDAAVADAAADRDKDLNSIPGEYTSCIAKAKGDADDIAACDAERAKDVADINEDYEKAVVEATAVYDICNSANSCSSNGGRKNIPNILSACLSTEDFNLWRNWKDHFFYAVSAAYAPDSSSTVCGANCVTTDSGNSSHAAIVLFSGQRVAGTFRNSLSTVGDLVDTKKIVENYLEGINNDGNLTYDAAAGNTAQANIIKPDMPTDFEADYLYCIDGGANPSDMLNAVACP